MTHALGLDGAATGAVLGWYDAIVAAVTDLSAGRPAGPDAARAVASSSATAVQLDGAGLSDAEVTSNVAVLLFGGIETTEGMIANAVAAPALGDPRCWPPCAPIRRCCPRRSRSRCGSSRPPR